MPAIRRTNQPRIPRRVDRGAGAKEWNTLRDVVQNIQRGGFDQMPVANSSAVFVHQFKVFTKPDPDLPDTFEVLVKGGTYFVEWMQPSTVEWVLGHERIQQVDRLSDDPLGTITASSFVQVQWDVDDATPETLVPPNQTASDLTMLQYAISNVQLVISATAAQQRIITEANTGVMDIGFINIAGGAVTEIQQYVEGHITIPRHIWSGYRLSVSTNANNSITPDSSGRAYYEDVDTP